MNEQDITNSIIKERNTQMGFIAEELMHLKELFQDCATQVFSQGEHIDQTETNIIRAVNNVEDGVDNLEVAGTYQKHNRGRLFDVCVLIGGVGLGALGLIAGPWIGIPTLAAGIGVSGGVVIARNKI